MIDLIDVKIQLQHKPFGNERIKLMENSPSSPPISKWFSKKITLHPNGSPVDVASMENGTVIQIRCCPLKPLQGHNVFGTNNVCLLGSAIICAVLDHLEISCTDAQRDAWRAGEFDIEALDITQRFALPDNISQAQLFQHMLRNTPCNFRPAALSVGAGVRMEVPRSTVAWTFYDKQQELHDRRTRSMKHLRAVAGDDAPRVWDGLWAAAGNSVRAELKLSHRYLKRHHLTRGLAWTIERVHRVYWDEMEKLHFGSYVPLHQLRHSINRVNIRPLRQVLELWARGADLNALCAKSTLDRHRSQIRRLTGIDILHDVPMIEALPLGDIFARRNMRKAFPAWSRTYPVCAFGAQTVQDTARATRDPVTM